MTTLNEKALYAPVSDYFLERGFLVLSGSQKEGIVGTSEFGVKVDYKTRYETVDILAIKWEENGQVHSIAVEGKLHGTARESAGASLDQATDYQIFFDEVHVATQKGELKDKESVLKALGVGHIPVDLESKKAEVSFSAQFRSTDRFSSTQNARQVVPRAVLPLMFKDVFGLPLRYMDASHGGLWVAKDIISNVQYNAGGSEQVRQTYFGINIEFIEDLREIVKRVGKARLSSCLKALGNKHTVTLGIDEARTDRRISQPIRSPAVDVNVNDLLKEIEKQAWLPQGTRRKSKPHLTIGCLLYKWDEPLTKQDYRRRLEEAMRKLTPLMEVFKACF